MTPLAGRDIVCFSYADWHGSWSTPQQLMTRLARDNRVLYVDQPRSFLYGLKKRSPKGEGWWEGPPLQLMDAGLHVYHPPHRFVPVGGLPLPVARAALSLNARMLARQINHVLRRLSFRDVILWDFSVLHGLSARWIPHALHLYDIADIWEEYAGNPRDRELIRWADAELTRRADLVFPSTEWIHETHAALNPKQVVVPHGADYEHFSKARWAETPVPPELAQLPRPIVGCIGVMDPARFDALLLDALAEARPGWSFVLVGPVLPGLDMARLETRPNVYLTGNKPIAELPNYLKAMDATLIPYRVNALTRRIFPLKLMEYLSGGKPVVSSAMKAVAAFAPLAGIAETPDEFLARLEQAIAEDSEAARDARQALAREHAWEAVAARKSRVVAEALAGREEA